jgi:hypothetical protein
MSLRASTAPLLLLPVLGCKDGGDKHDTGEVAAPVESLGADINALLDCEGEVSSASESLSLQYTGDISREASDTGAETDLVRVDFDSNGATPGNGLDLVIRGENGNPWAGTANYREGAAGSNGFEFTVPVNAEYEGELMVLAVPSGDCSVYIPYEDCQDGGCESIGQLFPINEFLNE